MVDKERLIDLMDTKLKLITEKINQILFTWQYSSTDQFLVDATDGTLDEAEPDAISLTNFLEKRDNLYQIKQTWNQTDESH